MAGPLLPSLLSLAVLAAAADAFSTAPSSGRRGPARVGPSSALSSSLVNDGVFQTSPPLRIEVRESKRGGPTADPSL